MQTKTSYFVGVLFAVFGLAIISGCNSSENKSETTTQATDSTGNSSQMIAEEGQPKQEGLTAGELDTLWIDKSAFTATPNRQYRFSFVFSATDKLTLHGWKLKPGNPNPPYDPVPDIKLNNGKTAKIKYDVGTYFTSLVIDQNDYGKIRQAITATTQIVVFIPVMQNNVITYQIYVSDQPMTMGTEPGSILAVTPTGVDANPSPPKID